MSTTSATAVVLLLVFGLVQMSGCGSGSSSSTSQVPLTLSGNWQFTMAPPADGSFLGGLQGGFLQQNAGAVKGAVAYSVGLPPNEILATCSSGSAAITGTGTGNVWTLTAVAGTQTFTLTGTQSSDGLSISGTYNSTAGTAADGAVCGTAQSGLQWTAVLVPPLTGPIQGNFHSTGGAAGLKEQEFVVSGVLTQGVNSGTDSATVMGSLTFLNAQMNGSDYPCFPVASVQGQISGDSVVLQLVGSDGTNLGQIGQSPDSAPGSGLQPVTFDLSQNAYVLQSLAGSGYVVTTNACPGAPPLYGDEGSVCLALNSISACQQPITLAPTVLTFSAQPINSPAASQTITLTNTYGSLIGGVTLTLTNNNGGQNNFTEADTCGANGASSQGAPVELGPEQSCIVKISFSPLQTCSGNVSPAKCLTATLTLESQQNNLILLIPITGGVSTSMASSRFYSGANRALRNRSAQVPSVELQREYLFRDRRSSRQSL